MNNGLFFNSLSSSLPHISRVQRCVQAHKTEGPSGTFATAPRLHHVGAKAEEKPLCRIFNGLRRGGKTHLGKPVAVEADRTGHHVTARGPDTLSQDRKGSSTKVNKSTQKWRHVCCHGEKVAFKRNIITFTRTSTRMRKLPGHNRLKFVHYCTT